MSSKYQILDNRPIHQWKVTELKEELKRRKLSIKGLKDDLVKRLDEAVRLEREAAEASEKDEANGFEGHVDDGAKDSEKVTVNAEVVGTIDGQGVKSFETAGKGNSGVAEPIETENTGKTSDVVDNDGSKIDKQDGAAVQVDINNSLSAVDQEVEHTGLPASVDSTNVGEEAIAHASTMETTITVTEKVLTEVVVSGQDSSSAEKNNEDSAAKLENVESKVQVDNEDTKPQLDCEIKPLCEDLVPDSSVPENQVSEVNPSLGSQVKYDSISTDSVSINQKNELKDTIITDNVKLEQDIVKPEMVEEPSSRNDVPVYDESHSMDVGGLHEKKASIEENNNNVSSPDLNKTNSSDDVWYPEKLNLDRSSGDDSMEEDLPETKQIDSKFNVDQLRDKVEGIEEPIVKEESSTIVVGDGGYAGRSHTHQDLDMSPAAMTAEKRKFHEQGSVGNNEPAKRQRRWNIETVKGSDPQSTTPRPANTPKDEPVALKRNFSRSDSFATDDAPKERIVPSSQRSPTNSLRIDRFLRPFTLKAVQELLGKTGNVNNFWMDQIKTHCYVTYSSIEEAIETRNAVYNLQWPPNGGRLLVAEFVDPEEVKLKLEAPPTQAASVSNVPTVPPTPPSSQPEPSPRPHKEQHPVPATLPPPPPLSKPPPLARDRLPSPPPLPEKVDPPIVTLDDLFRKTTATPRIYYLPLSEEQVAAKLAAQGKSTRQ
ncbi:actin cytoskeleton-regulatory complex protein PAN1-like [Abrus precatorius]|uniref:Actin cytoskeleton-regulatory complex protein PAN1-like n=1 Tax=Abrus precatorius TaxID=3816 RepID=A0A8B8JZZ2_ABRPR|nr:actin cytoskeleton-regulatory complex protein PAN1-like [Abrus precatorius]XP_027336944.1 actin cytoskeleton-regulatory complex protein PAN1-like [Abrus precatorius]XP_027336946.1 actin cytoskeleton-regulatory complex protein PAN1-like [Abrus precatorius]XP_027336947.1 actin cytoskeleton-regulatory complex protein PAN1-like [Abrus precatorius]XP_027336948.1 actin cytoskeleton-regulatory complex protein PAN1-like [Abrus precatorius]XP_027336949.1 actin cytoskeleton-regulatory complex protein